MSKKPCFTALNDKQLWSAFGIVEVILNAYKDVQGSEDVYNALHKVWKDMSNEQIERCNKKSGPDLGNRKIPEKPTFKKPKKLRSLTRKR